MSASACPIAEVKVKALSDELRAFKEDVRRDMEKASDRTKSDMDALQANVEKRFDTVNEDVRRVQDTAQQVLSRLSFLDGAEDKRKELQDRANDEANLRVAKAGVRVDRNGVLVALIAAFIGAIFSLAPDGFHALVKLLKGS